MTYYPLPHLFRSLYVCTLYIVHYYTSFFYSLYLFLAYFKQIMIRGHRDILQGTTCKSNLSGFVVSGGGVLSYCNHQLIKFEKDKISDLKNNFVIIKREREIDTLKKFPFEKSLCRLE